jgi:hypothetical protein
MTHATHIGARCRPNIAVERALAEVGMVYRYSLVWMLIGIIVSGLPTMASSEENPKSVIANLPKIDYSKQCNEKGECDGTVEEEVFGTLAKLSDRYLKRGMSKGDVAKVFGGPPDKDAESWNDVRFGNPVTSWRYAISLSGTWAFYIIFVNDRLDYFGQLMISYMLYSYGKPGWSFGDDTIWKYRFHGKEPG